MSKLSLRRIEQLLKELFPFFAFLSLTFGFLLFSAPNANAATNYAYYRAITVTSSASVASGTNVNFPMLVSSTIASWASVANGGAIQHLTTAPNGGIEPADLIFTSDSGCSSPLNFETESYSSSTGALVDWVNVPSLSAGTVIYACYDNTLMTIDQSHPSSTWNANYEAVYHLSEGAGSTGYDSTGVNNTTWNGTGGGSASTYYTTGNIGSYAGFFDGTSNYTQTTNTAWLPTGSAARTLMGWIKTSVTARQAYFGYGPSGAGETFNIESGISGAGKIYFVGYADDVSGNADIADGKWHQIAATYDGSKLTLYVDGQYDSSGTVALNTSITNPFVIGRQSYEDGSTFWYNAGSISDVALVNTNLSSSWILTEYNNQNSPSSFYSISSQQSESLSSNTSAIDQNSMGNSIILTENGATWTPGNPGSPTFTLSGGTGASITSQTVTSATSTTITINAGSTVGALTVTDPSTGETITLQVVLGPSFSWNSSYLYHQQLTLTNNTTSSLALGYSVSYTFNHAALVSAGKSLANGADIRIAYWNGSLWTELNRALDLSSSWNSTTTQIWFETQAAIPGSGTDTNYYLYYGNPSATPPSYDPHSATTTNYDYGRILAAANYNLSADHTTFTDGTDYWYAASPGYPAAYAADTWYAFSQDPSYFTTSQIKNFFSKLIAARDGNGDIPVALNTNGTAASYYDGYGQTQSYPTGDGIFFTTMMENIYYNESGDISQFASTSAYLKTALLNIPRDTTTTLVYVNPSAYWIPWGFEDDTLKTGDDLMGSLLYYEDSLDMASMYNAEGDATDTAFFTNQANEIKNNISTLWDGTDGMFYAATGQDNQIDVQGSAYAVYIGITTPSETTAIANYLINNYSTLTSGGYIRESPTDWADYYAMSKAGPGLYDSGRWSVANDWVATAMQKVSPSKAVQYITDFSNNSDMQTEWYGVGTSTVGNDFNLESPMGALAFILANPSLFPSATITSENYSNVFPLWDDFSSINSNWSNVEGAWNADNGAMNQVTVNPSPTTETHTYEDVKLTENSGLSNNFVLQADMKIDSYDVGDHSILGVCINSVDSGFPTAHGYCSELRGNDTTTAAILNEEVAWGSTTSFNWTSGTWYRTQIARVGSTIYSKIWAVGSAEPSSWQNTYTESNNLTSTNISLSSGYSTTEFDNLLVRPYVSSEPTVTAESEISSDATLSDLATNLGSLSPSFSSSQTSYTENVSNSVTSLTITPTVNQAAATVTINGISVISSDPSGTISLKVGSNTFVVVVTAEDELTKNTYTIIVTRDAPATVESGGSSAYNLSIDGGAEATADPNVTLSLYSTGAYTMEISNTSTFAGASWISYAASLPWTLASNTGEQTVYVRYQSVSGALLGSAEANIDLEPASASSSTPLLLSSLRAELNSLLAELASLEAQAGNQIASSTTSFIFTRDLQFGMVGNDVKQLQLFLITQNIGSAARKLKANGTTQYFGILTKNALIKFQKSVGIVPDSGYFGPITRAWVRENK